MAPSPATAHHNACSSAGDGHLSLRRMRIDTYHENVAYMHRDCEVYRTEGFKALSKVEVRTNGRSIMATLNVVDNGEFLTCNELGCPMRPLNSLACQQVSWSPSRKLILRNPSRHFTANWRRAS